MVLKVRAKKITRQGHSLSSSHGNGTPLQYSCLENPTDGEVWWAAIHGVAKSRTRLSEFPFIFHFPLSCIGEGNGNPLQYSCLENPKDRGAWWAAIYGVAQSRTRLKRLSSSMALRHEKLAFTSLLRKRAREGEKLKIQEKR